MADLIADHSLQDVAMRLHDHMSLYAESVPCSQFAGKEQIDAITRWAGIQMGYHIGSAIGSRHESSRIKDCAAWYAYISQTTRRAGLV